LTPLLVPLGLCLAVITFCYIAVASAAPFGTCTRCHGHSRTCYRCRGTGKRARLIWQATAYLLRVWKDSHR
jgi:cytochrome c553